MKLLGIIRLFFKLSDEDKAIYYNEISLDNAKRAFILCLIGIPVSLFHIAVFASKLDGTVDYEHKWVHSIIYSHLSLLILASLFGLLLYLFLYGKSKRYKAARISTNIMLVLLLFLGSAITAFDQYVTPAITPFVNIIILVGLFFQLRPTLSLIYFTASYIVFCGAVSLTQVNQEILVSNQVNGLSISVIGMCLSMILWYSKLTRINQRNQITRQNKALSESNAEKDRFFSIIAHDLKSPFNSILGFSDLLLCKVKEEDYEGLDEYANIIKQSSKSAMDLLSNLMDWSKAHTGRMDFYPTSVNLNDLVKELESLFAGSMLQKQQLLTIEIPENMIVYADRNMLYTVLRNLISNAVKFSHSNGRIVLTAVEKQMEYEISVTDHGVGIPNEYISKLFRIDESYSTIGTQQEKGTGLGLVLCKELIERHGGHIGCESEPGIGSRFYFSLPHEQLNIN